MPKEKKRRHDQGHEHHKHHKHHHEPTLGEQSDQGTDMPQSQHQLEEEKTKLAKNLKADVIAASAVSGGTEIILNRGSDDGVEVGTAGYVIGRQGENMADFTITKVAEGTCHALVEGIGESQVQGSSMEVVLNP